MEQCSLLCVQPRVCTKYVLQQSITVTACRSDGSCLPRGQFRPPGSLEAECVCITTRGSCDEHAIRFTHFYSHPLVRRHWTACGQTACVPDSTNGLCAKFNDVSSEQLGEREGKDENTVTKFSVRNGGASLSLSLSLSVKAPTLPACDSRQKNMLGASLRMANVDCTPRGDRCHSVGLQSPFAAWTVAAITMSCN